LFGIPISSTVIINPKTTITNNTLPKGFDRADSFTTHWDEKVDKMGTIEVFKTLGTIMKLDRVKEIAGFLLKSHKPKTYDYEKKYPIKKELESFQPIETNTEKSIIKKSLKQTNTKLCSKCKNDDIEVVYGKYGYYFKCQFCDGNTAIKLSCSHKECKPKIKKSKLNFYQVCEVCGLNELFFTNKEKVLS
jgi:hypothetical protein